jgi:membrane protease YdiL (CAAX protease family)
MKTKTEPVHTKLSYLLGSLALGILLYLGIRHLNDVDEFGQSWGKYALLQATFCLIGLVGSLLIVEQKIFPTKFRKITIDTGIRVFIILICSMISQYLVKTQLSVSTSERALYYLFAGIGEELFFRLFLMETIRKIAGDTPASKMIGVIFSTIAFTAIHVNYYDDIAQLTAVFIGGLILAAFYLIWRDITANMLAHFLLNLVAVGNWLVVLTANFDSIVTIFAVGFFAIGLICYIFRKQNVKLQNAASILIPIAAILFVGVLGSYLTTLPAGP